MKSAVETFVAKRNAAATPAERLPRPTFFDDGCSATGGESAAREISAARSPPFTAVFGHPCRSSARAAASNYAAQNLLTFITGFTPIPPRDYAADRPSDRSGPLFRIPGDLTQGAVIAAYIKLAPAPRVAILRDKTQAAVRFATSAQTALLRNGITIAATDIFAGGDKDFRASAARFRALGITHVIFAGFPAEATLFADDITRELPDIEILGPETLAVPEFATTAAAHSRRLRLVLPPDDLSLNSLQHQYGAGTDNAVLDRQSLALIAAIEAWASAINTAGTTSASSISELLMSRNHKTALGPLIFNRRGASSLPSLAIARFIDGSWRTDDLSPR